MMLCHFLGTKDMIECHISSGKYGSDVCDIRIIVTQVAIHLMN
jgi:hypothetical protein